MTSLELFEQAKGVFPGGVNSPVRAFRHVNKNPLYFNRGDGAYLFDIDNREYIDFCGAFGPLILGHNHPVVRVAIEGQLKLGTLFGTCHPGELELALWIRRGYPFLNRMRFLNSGTEAVITALRLARAYTGRDKILKFEGCYHGHSDSLLVKSGSGVATLSEASASSGGIPRSLVTDTLVASYASLDGVASLLKSHYVAAVLVEPIPANFGLWVPDLAHIQKLAELTKQTNTLLIFDEVITGFRLGYSGATGYFDIQPDMVVLGKVIGGGLPLAAVLGPHEILDQLAPQGDVYQAGTFCSNPLSLAAGTAALSQLFQLNPYRNLALQTEKFAQALAIVLEKFEMAVSRIGSIFWIHPEGITGFPPSMSERYVRRYSQLFSSALDQGVYLPPSPYEVCFISIAHTEEILAAALEKFNRCRI